MLNRLLIEEEDGFYRENRYRFSGKEEFELITSRLHCPFVKLSISAYFYYFCRTILGAENLRCKSKVCTNYENKTIYSLYVL